MTIDELVVKIINTPNSVEFPEVIEVIETAYCYTPTRFNNGIGSNMLINEAGTNEGSCKIFSFCKLNNLNEKQTLTCFGKYYREDVLGHPNNDDHSNIRNYMSHGWEGISFDGNALQLKA